MHFPTSVESSLVPLLPHGPDHLATLQNWGAYLFTALAHCDRISLSSEIREVMSKVTDNCSLVLWPKAWDSGTMITCVVYSIISHTQHMG